MNAFLIRGLRGLAGCVSALMLTLGTVHAAPVISLEPATGSHAVGETFELRLMGSGLTDVYAFQFALDFAPGSLSVRGVSEGDALQSAGTTFFVAGAADDAAGRLDLSGNTLIGPVAGFTGDGWLATIVLQAVAPGVTRLELTDLLLLDSALSVQDVGGVDAEVTIRGGGSVPLPSTLALVALGMAGLAQVGSRRRQGSA